MIIFKTYHRLMERFLNREISVSEFETEFFRLWDEWCDAQKTIEPESPIWSGCDFVDETFTALNVYRPNPDPTKHQIDETQLRVEVAEKFAGFTDWLNQYGHLLDPPPSKPARARRKSHTRQRTLRRRLITVLILIALTVLMVPIVLGIITTYVLLYAPCGEDTTTPADFGHSYDDITIQARAGGAFRAYFIPGTNGAAIIIPPTTAQGRGARLHLADLYADHGHAVITYESRRCADMGALSLGYKETNEVGDVLDYLLTRDDVDPDQIGITGFSSAGATSIMAAARFPEIGAVIAEGGYDDFAEGSIRLGTGGFFESVYKWSVVISYRVLNGESIHKLSPLDRIGDISPRPILLIYGSYETTLAGARRQQAAAGDNAALWVVDGAGHGLYWTVAGEEYERRVIAFFDEALLQ
jgi:pimeloyl-ACP methyl ester carboxylesterase